MRPPLVALVVFLGLLLAAFAAWVSLGTMRRARRGELTARLGEGQELPRILRARQLDAVGEALGPVGLWLHRLLLRSGHPATVGELAGTIALLTLASPLLLDALLDGPVALLGAGLGLVPLVVLYARAAARSRLLSLQLPDALDIIARAMRAGHSFTDALRMAAAELPNPIGDELAQAAEEHRLGLELRDCLVGLVERTPDSFDLRMFVSAVLLNRETGGNLIEILDNLAETIRERVVFEGKVRALTAEVRTSAYILASLPFLAAITLLTVQPDYLLPLLDPGLGRTLLIGGVVSMVTGAFVMQRLSQVEA